MRRLRTLWVALCLITTGLANGQNLDDQGAPGGEDGPGQYYALLFAGDVYEHWNDLQNPVNDARTLGEELQENYGFEVDLVENPTLETVLTKIRDYATRSYNKNDHLLIFFAGHGKFDDIDGEGYLVTTDSRADDETNLSYIPYSQLRTRVNNIPSEHVLLVLDACFGGTFDPGVRGNDPYAGLSRDEFLNRKLRFKTRRYITSGGKEYVPDGRPGYHSPFMRQWLEALRTYGGTDGILTLGEIYQHLEYVNPIPIPGQFGDNEPGSDFLFLASFGESTPTATSDVASGQPPEEAAPAVRAEKAPDDEAAPAEAVPEAPEEETPPPAETQAIPEDTPAEEAIPETVPAPAEAETEAAAAPEDDQAEAATETPAEIAMPEDERDTAEIDSLHLESTSTLVDHVRRSMERVKNTVPAALRQTPVYQEAAVLEERGKRMYEARKYPKAAVHFDEARTKYEQAALAEIAEVVEVEITPALQKTIDGYVQTLKYSVEAEEVGGMGAMYYRDRDWGAFFEAAEEITAEVRPEPVQVTASQTTVMVELALTYKDAEAQPQQETLQHLWLLKDMGGDWLLTRVTPQPN